tara:strand:+ start:293 stop:493 length:201 start_codon:yes stop_codon:yes gene_type:complete
LHELIVDRYQLSPSAAAERESKPQQLRPEQQDTFEGGQIGENFIKGNLRVYKRGNSFCQQQQASYQ